jgi:hypothetical protein
VNTQQEAEPRKRSALSVSEARALVDEHGSIAAAARAYGVNRGVMWRWLNPERWREYSRNWAKERYANDPEWREQLLADQRERYANWTPYQQARHAFRNRRTQALLRMEERNQRKEDISG